MTDKDIVERLNTLHDSLDALRELSQHEGLRADRLTSYIDLIEHYFNPLHECLNARFEKGLE